MYKKITIIFVLFLSVILFKFNVYAECTYNDRKELLEKVKNIEIFFDPNIEKKYFEFKLYNFDENIYITILNNKTNESTNIYYYDTTDNYYSFIDDNIYEKEIYTITFYSNTDSCYGNKLLSKRVTKRVINKYYYDSVCKGIEDYKYCVPILNDTFKISEEKILKNINDYKESLKSSVKDPEIKKFGINDILSLIKKYWYILVIILIITITIIVIVYINKKRGDLK